MPFKKLMDQFQISLREGFQSSVLSSLSLASLALSLIAVFAALLGAWQLGAEWGWAKPFFIIAGPLSRDEFWFVIAVASQTMAFFLDRWDLGSNGALLVRPAKLLFAATANSDVIKGKKLEGKL